MIKINNKQYDNYDTKIVRENFETILSGKKINGIAPFIEFNIKNNTLIGIETRLPKEILENMNINEKIDISKCLTDITYEDEKGWISIITGKYNCYLTRISNNSFKIELEIDSKELEKINININDNIELL